MKSPSRKIIYFNRSCLYCRPIQCSVTYCCRCINMLENIVINKKNQVLIVSRVVNYNLYYLEMLVSVYLQRALALLYNNVWWWWYIPSGE